MNAARDLHPSTVAPADSTSRGGSLYLGRHVLGLAAILFGVLTLSWRDFNMWQQIRPLGRIAHREILTCAIGAIELLGGLAIQWRRTARAGAVAIGTVFLFFALLWILTGLEGPLTWGPWGNSFEQLSAVSGAAIVYASFEERDRLWARKISRAAYLGFGICVLSFLLGVLPATCGCDILKSGGIPGWLFPGKAFWAVTVILAFPLASVALLTGRCALLAARLLTAMIMIIGLLYWLPAPFRHFYSDQHINWAGNAENLAIGAGAWIVADLLRRQKAASP